MSIHEQSIIVLITRYPEVGKVKTRLIKSHGEKGACNLHDAMTKFTLGQCQSLGLQIQVHYLGGDTKSIQDWLSGANICKQHQINTSTTTFFPQASGNLGHKMFAALKQAFTTLYENNPSSHTLKKVIIIGSDCPDNRKDNLSHALDLLEKHSVVLGPSLDGGYYLIGIASAAQNLEALYDLLSQKIKLLFQDIEWGTETVFENTIAKLKLFNLNYALLAKKSDVDFAAQVPKKISIIIPTLNEEDNLHNLLLSLPPSFNTEIIVVDANSTDKSLEIAKKFNAITLSSEAGRAKQINNAVAIASGEILFFLHADSEVPNNWDINIRATLDDKHNSLGYFTFALKENFFTKPIIEWGVRFRCKHFALPFGDQGLFVRKCDFENWNLPIIPILEDVFLVKCAQKHGQIVALSDSLITSGRRWFKHGFIRTTIINASVLLCAKLGMDLEEIKQAYLQGQNPIVKYITKLFNSS